MTERALVCGLLLLLSAGPLLEPFVGGQVASVLVVAPAALIAYRILFVRVMLSARYRLEAMQYFRDGSNLNGHRAVFALFVLLFLTSLVRAALAGAMSTASAGLQIIQWASVITLLFAVAIDDFREQRPSSLIRLVVLAFALYAGVNLAFYFADVRNEAVESAYLMVPQEAVMLKLVGIEAMRAALPIGPGINSSGLQVAAGFPLGVAILSAGVRRSTRRLALIGAACSAIAILITDSRGAMLAAIGGAAWAYAPRAMLRRSKWLLMFLPLAPFLLIPAVSSVGAGGGLAEFTRAGASGALSGRPLIWGTIVVFLSSFQWQHLLGYGAFGQVTSGASSLYGASLLDSYVSPQLAGAHNSVLQAVLDVGYLGAAVQLILFWRLLDTFGRSSCDGSAAAPLSLAALAATVSMLLLGVGAETVSIATPNTLFLFLALNVYAISHSPAPAAPRLAAVAISGNP